MELSIVMPCLNEAETLASCIAKAKLGIERAGVTGEVIVADNGSTDKSIEIAESLGARVVRVSEKGYGGALRGGIAAANSKWIVMGDADDSYDFSQVSGFVEHLKAGKGLVMGCRFPKGGGTIIPGAMPWKNQWFGNPLLSFIGRLFFKSPIQDFQCGLRAFTREAYESLDLKTTGMEFASEMVMKAALKRVAIAQTPITLHPDGRSRPPHMRPWRDGWRNLRFMLIYSPRWLFLMPGLVLMALGLIVSLALCLKPINAFGIAFDAGTQLVAAMSIVAGLQMVFFACFTKVFGIAEGLLPEDPRFAEMFRFLTLERGIAAGATILLIGFGLLIREVLVWQATGFGALPYADHMRLMISAVTAIIIGVQIISSSFFTSVLGLKTSQRRPPSTAGS